MDSIGDKLRTRREEKGHTIDQAARDTHIARRFIEAMEAEHFDVFPGESYLIGFLRNYSNYLELDSNEVVSLYRNTQIQEQPSPVVELLDTRPKIRPLHLLIIFAVIVVLGGGIFALVTFLPPAGTSKAATPTHNENEPITGQTVTFSAEILEQEFTADSHIVVPIGDTTVIIDIDEISSPLTLSYGDSEFSIEEGQSGFLDINADGDPDLRLAFRSVMPNGNPVLRFDRAVAGTVLPAGGSSTQQTDDSDIPMGSTSEPSRERSIQTILNANASGSFFVEAIFRGPVLFKYLADGGARIENHYESGNRLQLEVSNDLYIWASNGGKIQMTIGGTQVRLGTDGEPAAYKVAWNGTALELIPLY